MHLYLCLDNAEEPRQLQVPPLTKPSKSGIDVSPGILPPAAPMSGCPDPTVDKDFNTGAQNFSQGGSHGEPQNLPRLK